MSNHAEIPLAERLPERAAIASVQPEDAIHHCDPCDRYFSTVEELEAVCVLPMTFGEFNNMLFSTR